MGGGRGGDHPAVTATATHIGTATVLLEIDGVTLLTDPAFDPVGSAYDVGTPIETRSLTAPALGVADLPPIDVVLLSHDEHADNLDHAGRRLLTDVGTVITTASGATRVTGLARRTVGLEPWQQHQVGNLRITATPARHGPEGIEPLAGDVVGFVVEAPELTIYVSGDTVYYPELDEIGRRFAIDVAFLHVGDAQVAALGEVSLTMNGDQAVQLARALGEPAVIPIHYGSWAHFTEEIDQVVAAFGQAGLADRLHLLTPAHRQPLAFP